jgi:tripartite-type tricarboxylate transporter receptor subunit TctC
MDCCSRFGVTRRAAIVAAAGVAAVPRAARSQSTIRRILCGAPPGSTPDVIARHYAQRWSAIVDNRPGAASLIAVSALRQSEPDGQTLLLGPADLFTLYPFVYASLAYDPAVDLVPVAFAAETTLALAVGPAVPEGVRTLRDYVDWARGSPGRATYGSPGYGTVPHVLAAALAVEGKFEAVHVAYAGGPPAIVDLVGGRLASAILPDGLLRPMAEAGKLRLLATTGPQRHTAQPALPTVAEEGYPRLTLRAWFGFIAPRGTPTSAVEAAAGAIKAIAAAPESAAALGESGYQALVGGPAEMQQRIALERRSWGEMVAAAGLRPQ